MKNITVRYFAGFREHSGTESERIATNAGTAREVFGELRHRHGSSEPLGHCKVAINDQMAEWDSRVEDGDTVFLFPPVAGG